MGPVVVFIVGVEFSAFLGGEGEFIAYRRVDIVYIVEEIAELDFLVCVVEAEGMDIGYAGQRLDFE